MRLLDPRPPVAQFSTRFYALFDRKSNNTPPPIVLIRFTRRVRDILYTHDTRMNKTENFSLAFVPRSLADPTVACLFLFFQPRLNLLVG